MSAIFCIETSHETIRRLTKSQGMVLQPSVQKLTSEQLAEAYELLKADIPFREVAQRFDISEGSLCRLVQRDEVTLRPKGQKRTPTQRKLTLEQQQEAHNLVKSGVSLRQTAKQLGISRSAVERVLKEGEKDSENEEK
jgi:transposase